MPTTSSATLLSDILYDTSKSGTPSETNLYFQPRPVKNDATPPSYNLHTDVIDHVGRCERCHEELSYLLRHQHQGDNDAILYVIIGLLLIVLFKIK